MLRKCKSSIVTWSEVTWDWCTLDLDMSSSNTRPGVTYVYHEYISQWPKLARLSEISCQLTTFAILLVREITPRFRYFIYWVLISKLSKSFTGKRSGGLFSLWEKQVGKKVSQSTKYVLVTFFTASCSPGPLLH